MEQLPNWFQRFSTAAMLVIELADSVPDSSCRGVGGSLARGCISFLQTLIFLTGNYTFFNLLTMALCLFLFDDAALGRLRLRSRTRSDRAGGGGGGRQW